MKFGDKIQFRTRILKDAEKKCNATIEEIFKTGESEKTAAVNNMQIACEDACRNGLIQLRKEDRELCKAKIKEDKRLFGAEIREEEEKKCNAKMQKILETVTKEIHEKEEL